MSTTVYLPKELKLVRTTLVSNEANDLRLFTEINLQAESIKYGGDKSDNAEEKPLSGADVYVFEQMIDEVKATPEFMEQLLKMNFVQRTLLPCTLGPLSVPFNNMALKLLFTFSSLVIPFQVIDSQKESKREYAAELQNAFNACNNATLYNFKKVARYVLLVPGIVLSPIILLVAITALKNFK